MSASLAFVNQLVPMTGTNITCSGGFGAEQTWDFTHMTTLAPGAAPDLTQTVIMGGIDFTFNVNGMAQVTDLHTLNFSNYAITSAAKNGTGWGGWGNWDGGTLVQDPQPPTAPPNQYPVYGVTVLYNYSQAQQCKADDIRVGWSNIYNPREYLSDVCGNYPFPANPTAFQVPLGTFIVTLTGTYATNEGGKNGWGSFMVSSQAAPLQIVGTTTSLPISPFITLVQQNPTGIWTFTVTGTIVSFQAQFVRAQPPEGPITGIYSDYTDGGGLFWFNVVEVGGPAIQVYMYGNVCISNYATSGASTQGIRGVIQTGVGTAPGSERQTFYITQQGNNFVAGPYTITPSQPVCQSDTQCKQPGLPACNTATGKCVPCTNPSYCLAGQNCVNFQCVTPAPCQTNPDCVKVNPASPICNKGTCVQCVLNTDCGAGQVCSAQNTCQSSGGCPPGGCPSGYTCIGGQCVPTPPPATKSNTTLYIIIGVVAFVVIAVIAFFLLRKK